MELEVLAAVERVNERQKGVLVEKLMSRLGADLKGRTIALWGLAFKPNTDDMREAPSLVIIQRLLAAGAIVRAYDPVAMTEAARVLELGGVTKGIELVDSAAEALKGADALLIATEWKEFRNPDFDAIKASLKQPLVVDGRNLYEPAAMRRHGIDYLCIGRPGAA